VTASAVPDAVRDRPGVPAGLDDDLWKGAPEIALRNARTGGALRMPTTAQVVVSQGAVAARFRCAARSVRVTMSRYKDKVWQEGAVEVYLRPPGDPRLYEFQVNPIGTTRDLVVHNPGTAAQAFDDSWSCAGLRTSARVERDRQGDLTHWEAMFAIPMQAMTGTELGSGQRDGHPATGWRIGLFRLEYDPEEFGALTADADADAHADVFLTDLGSL
jgi:hypothetical protein